MKVRGLFCVFVISFLAACQEGRDETPTIYLDQAHNQLTDNGKEVYDIAPTDTLVVDATDFEFINLNRKVGDKTKKVDIHEDVVEVWVKGGSGMYQTTWPQTRQVTLRAQTLKSLRRSTTFNGFTDPEVRYLVMIGRSDSAGRLKTPTYIARVKVNETK